MFDEEQKTLIDTIETNQKIASELKVVKKRIVLISAFVSNSIDWIESLCPPNIERILITRGRFSDFKYSLSNIDDIKKAFDAGWRVGFVNSLHAKIYLFDESKMIVGSSNLTVSGLALYGMGNLEFSCATKPTAEDVGLIEKLIQLAAPLSKELLRRMQDILKHDSIEEFWPIKETTPSRPLLVSDMLWQSPLSDTQNNEDLTHDLDILGISSIVEEELSAALMNTRIIHWLINTVKDADDSECYFGYLSKKLHTEIGTESKIYRKQVKNFIRNLFDYISFSSLSIFIIDRPNYSERIRLNHEILSNLHSK